MHTSLLKTNPTLIMPGVALSDTGNYHVRVSDALEDPAWDAFLAQTPGGHHVQSSLWAQVKGLQGWRAVRLVITQRQQIVAGAQLLLRQLPVVGAIGYVPKGPVLASDDPKLTQLVVEQLHELAREQRVRYLIVQPANNGQALVQQMPDWGFQPGATAVAPTATVLVDLTPPLDEILAQMKKKTRYGIRRGQKDGVTVRAGAEQDLPLFHQLLVATSQRQGFAPFPLAYFINMWRILNERGHIWLLVSEFENEVVSAQLVLPFGDTVYAKQFGWSGRHGLHRPNEMLDWTTIEWGKAQGYHYYDLEGIKPEAARAVLQGETLPEALEQTPTTYKLGFGGQVALFPEAYGYIYNPLLRSAYNTLFPKVKDWPVAQALLNRFRTG